MSYIQPSYTDPHPTVLTDPHPTTVTEIPTTVTEIPTAANPNYLAGLNLTINARPAMAEILVAASMMLAEARARNVISEHTINPATAERLATAIEKIREALS